jgi:hypothetical protein
MSAVLASILPSGQDMSYGWLLRRARRVLVTGLAIGAAALLQEFPRVALLIWPIPVSVLARIGAIMMTTETMTGLMVGTGLEFFWWMRQEPADASRRRIAIPAILALPLVFALILKLLPLNLSVIFEVGLAGSMEAFWLYILWRTLVVGSIATIYLLRKRHVFEEETRINTANREWEYARRAVLESRLQAIQARVEPQLLFDSLARMRERYAQSSEDGEVLLEALTDFLRCGLPQMRTATGTVFLECALLKSYAVLLNSAAFSRPVLTCDIDHEAAAATIAAGSLQGLVAPWLRSASPHIETAFHIRASAERGVIRIVVAGPPFEVAASLATTAQSLREIHGSRSSVTQRTYEGRLECHLEYPDDIDQPIHHATTSNHR